MHNSPTDLDAQIAQRMFGWEWDEGLSAWLAPEPVVYAETPPAYTTDPAATAQVWAWLETREGLEEIRFLYEGAHIYCALERRGSRYIHEEGATWKDALCRAALALADTLTQEDDDGTT